MYRHFKENARQGNKINKILIGLGANVPTLQRKKLLQVNPSNKILITLGWNVPTLQRNTWQVN